MNVSRSTIRRSAVALAAAGLAAGALALPNLAQASTAKPMTADNAAAAASLSAKLGASSAGSYLDAATGRMVVNVTDQAAADSVRAAGAVPRLVKHSSAQLSAATSTLAARATIPGTAWAVDPVSNQVVVSADSTVTGARRSQLDAAVATLGDAVRVQNTAGRISLRIAGGDAIYSGQYRCSLGFNVHSGSTYYFLTAGHCGNIGATWYSNQSHTTVIGTRSGTSFPGNDYAIIKYSGSASHPSAVDLYSGSQTITSAADAYVGESVRRSGSTTHVHSGTVRALNATVNYAEGTVSGLIQTNVCAEGGDSGGSLFDGSKAIGLTSGGSGDCTSGGTTYFQPVTEPLSVYGVSVG